MTATPIQPLRFRPIFKKKIWGGRRLEEVLELRLPAAGEIGEVWLVSDRDEDPSVVEEGFFEGRSLRSLIGENPMAVLGVPDPEAPFPLLVKLLDVAGRLSLQVHPDDGAAAREGEKDPGKEEAWLFLRLGSRARVVAGVREGVDAGALRDALERGGPSPCLRDLPVRPGDLLPLPAGTVHFIEDAVLLEVQTNSDLTYRLCDWGRLGEDGRPRALHLEKGLRALRADSRPSPARESAEVGARFRFGVAEGPRLRAGTSGRPTVVVPLAGKGRVRWPSGSLGYAAGEGWLVPAALRAWEFEAQGGAGRWATAVPGPASGEA